jgi:hypothetical protein
MSETKKLVSKKSIKDQHIKKGISRSVLHISTFVEKPEKEQKSPEHTTLSRKSKL